MVKYEFLFTDFLICIFLTKKEKTKVIQKN